MELQGLGYQQAGIKANKYLYQEKEFQDGLNLNIYDFHARGYDPAIGRTMQMDPHAENYLDLSPYSWGANNPISIIDPTGMDTVHINSVNMKTFNTEEDVIGLDQFVVTAGSRDYPSLSGINAQNQTSMSGWGGGYTSPNDLDVIVNTEPRFVGGTLPFLPGGIGGWSNIKSIFGAFKNLRSLFNAAKGGLKPLGLGSTAKAGVSRVNPVNLTEELAMKEIMSNPSMGNIAKLKKGMTDNRWHKNDGWQKMTWNNGGVEIHYAGQWQNGVLKAVDDFKIIGK